MLALLLFCSLLGFGFSELSGIYRGLCGPLSALCYWPIRTQQIVTSFLVRIMDY